jgi:hypothetical protein
MKKWPLLFLLAIASTLAAQGPKNDFKVKAFHLDLRIQVMPLPVLEKLALRLHGLGINTLIMEYEGSYPFQQHPLIPNRYAYTKEQIRTFVRYCDSLRIDLIPLQQSFGHVEYILRNPRYAALREDPRDLSQVCPLQTTGDSLLFTDLYKELAATHHSQYIHIGCDETHLLGHCPRCRKKVAEQGISRLYIDYVRMLCNIVISLGKRPVLWADIALKYPEAIKELPPQTIFVDWNYGWDMNNFGEHEKLVESGYEIWGAPALRSHPDNYFLTQWEKHFRNIRDFIPACRRLGYQGIVMTSWSTSGEYSTVYESTTDLIDLYAVRHVYPLGGFNILLAAYAKAISMDEPLNIEGFIEQYAHDHYGFNKAQADECWKALKAASQEVSDGVVEDPHLSLKTLTDSARRAADVLHALKPTRGKEEFAHYVLMADIRLRYLEYQGIWAEANAADFSAAQTPVLLTKLERLKAESASLDKRFARLNGHALYPAALAEENQLRNIKIELLIDRLANRK